MMRGAPAPKTLASSTWVKVKEHRGHESSVNSIAWAPVECGLHLACGSSDGRVSILSYVVEEGTWRVASWNAHQIGCNAVAWCPTTGNAGSSLFLAGSASPSGFGNPIMRLASGGCDNLIKIWMYINTLSFSPSRLFVLIRLPLPIVVDMRPRRTSGCWSTNWVDTLTGFGM